MTTKQLDQLLTRTQENAELFNYYQSRAQACIEQFPDKWTTPDGGCPYTPAQLQDFLSRLSDEDLMLALVFVRFIVKGGRI